jgi:hypothetical protein
MLVFHNRERNFAMPAVLEYEWSYIAPAASVGLFLHGFAQSDVGVLDAIPLNIGDIGTANTPLFDIQLTQGEVSIHVDGTYARTLAVQNLAPFNATGANLYFVSAS